MLRKNNKKLIISYFENNLNSVEGDLNKTIYENTQRVLEEGNSRGV
jgi:hypothetical protein